MADENKDNTPLPQYDRGKCKTELGFIQTLFRLKEVDKQGVIPAIVRSYDRKPESQPFSQLSLMLLIRRKVRNLFLAAHMMCR